MFDFFKFKNGRNCKADNTANAGAADTAGRPTAGTAPTDMDNGEGIAQQPLRERTAKGASSAQRQGSTDCKQPTRLKWFIFYRSFSDAMEGLSDESRLRLYDAMAAYSFYGIVPQLDGYEKNLWTLIRTRLDLNAAKAIEKSNKTKSE